MSPYLVVFVAAFLTGLMALWIVRRVALAVGFVDKPDLRRKLHEAPIPLGGGLAVWSATWVGLGASVLALAWGPGEATGDAWFYASLALASFSTLVLGMVDDRVGLRGSHKLAGQLVAACILVGLGFRIDAIGGFGLAVELGVFAVPVTLFWILLVVNAFNLIDGMDGFCGSVGLVAALALALLAYLSGRPVDAFAGLAIAGALAAFLKDNLPPARIYLGDAGSMTLGLMISALSIRACTGGNGGAVSILPLVALVALPLLDVLTALGRRWLTGHSLFTPDRGHIHHRLRGRFGRTSVALAVAVVLATIGAGGAMLSKISDFGDGAACLSLVTSVALLVGTDTFGGSELRLLLLRLRLPLAKFLTRRSALGAVIRHECHLIGSRDWAAVWNPLVREVEAADLRRVELAIEMPAVGETYHGLWAVSGHSEGRSDWSVVHSIQVAGNQAGTLRVAGSADASQDRYLDTVVGLVRDLEARIEEELARVLVSRPEGGISPAVYQESAVQPRYGTSLA